MLPGRHALSVEFAPTGPADPHAGKGTPGDITLFIDGEPAGSGSLPVTVPIMMGIAAGVSVGAPVVDTYTPPYRFTGRLERIVYDISGEHIVDHEAEIRAAMAHQ